MPPKCHPAQRVDVGFVMDASGSVGASNWKVEQEFIEHLASEINISPSGGQASVTVYSSTANIRIKFSDYQTYATFKNAVKALKYTRGGTRIDKALEVANNDMFSATNGMRPEAPKVLVFITDGKHYGPDFNYTAWGDQFRQRQIKVVVVGIGNVDTHNLIKLVESESDMHNVSNFESLDTSFAKDFQICDLWDGNTQRQLFINFKSTH